MLTRLPLKRSSLHRTLATLALALALLATPATAQKQNEQDMPEPTILDQRDDRIVAELPNRMIVVTQELPTAPVVSTQVWVSTGSIYEQQHVGAGLSHFLEHLLSGGTTTTRSEQESNAILGRIGARTNAATSLDSVRYYINTTADHAETAVDLLSDWMQNSKITEHEFKREKQVIQREFSMGQGETDRIFWKLTQQARYQAHPARHPTIGYLDRFQQITRDQLIDFYETMYVPNNMVFVVVGDIDKENMLQAIHQRWADAPAGDLPELSFPEEPGLEKPRETTGHADIARPRLRLAWPGTTLAGEHDYALDLLSVILGEGETSRLKQTVRDEQGLVTSVDAYNLSFHWGKGFFGIDSRIAPDAAERAGQGQAGDTEANLEAVKQALLEQVERLRDRGVTEDELARAKRMVQADVLSSNQKAEGIASRIARDTIGMADPDYLPKYAETIEELTTRDLQDAAKAILENDKLITVRLLPATEEQPVTELSRPEEDEAGAADLAEQPVELDNRHLLGQLQQHLKESSSVAEAFEVAEPEQFTLDNGLRVIVQRSNVVPSVSMQLYWLGGLLGDRPGREGTTHAMAQMLTRGTEYYTADELAREIESLGGDLSAEAGNNTTYIQASAMKDDWPTVLGLLAEVALRPRFPQEEWDRLQPRVLARIASQNDSWSGQLRNQFREVYFGDHPWSQSPLGRAEVVEDLIAEDLARHHRQQLRAGRAVLAITGDIDPARVREQVRRRFTDMPGGGGGFSPPEPGKPTARLVTRPTEKPVAAVQIGMGPGLRRDDPDYPAMEVLGNVMSDFPTGWLEQQLRGQGGGLVYAVGAFSQTGIIPGYFTVLFNSSPNDAAEALEKTLDTIDRAKTERVAETDLARAKAKTLTGEFLGRQSNAERAKQMALNELYGAEDPLGRQFVKRVRELNAGDLQQVARKYLKNPVALVMSHEPIPREELEQAIDGHGMQLPVEAGQQ
jgi:zinc protease